MSKSRWSLDMKAGNRVLFGKWSGTKLDGEEFLIMKASDIMVIIEV